jgi:hypothetical protein
VLYSKFGTRLNPLSKSEDASGRIAVQATTEGSTDVRDYQITDLKADDGSTEIRRAKALFRGFYEALSDEIDRVRALGGEVKDIDQGLVDFPASRRGEEILLCWRLGEKKIGYWHAVESGYAGRRPIDDDVARAPQPLD